MTQRIRTITIFAITIVTIGIGSLGYIFGVLDTWQEKIFDRFFVKKIPPSHIVILGIDDESINTIGQWPWPRKVFSDVLEDIGGAGQVGIDVLFSEASRFGSSDDLEFKESIGMMSDKIVLPIQFDERAGKILKPIPLFLDSDPRLGFVNVLADGDGVGRKIETRKGSSISFSESLLTGPLLQPVPEILRLDYRGPAKTFLTIPFVDVYRHKVPPEFFRDKIVLIGVTAPSFHDIINTPFGFMPGIEVHANAIATITSQKFFKEVHWLIALILLTAIVLIALLLILKIKNIYLLLISLAVELLLITVTSIFLFGFYILTPVLYEITSFLLSVGVFLSFQYITESKEKRFIKKTFQYYLSPALIEELLKEPGKIKLGGEKRRVTILATDIRNFTSISEQMSPEILTGALNDHLSVMTESILDNKGLIEKYAGDAIMAFWGAPLKNDNQAVDACLAAIHMSRKLKPIQEKSLREGKPVFRIGIGLNTGSVVVGNIGSHRRFNYGLIGDEANFCARLEGLNKVYKTTCLISESTKKEIESKGIFHIREIDVIIAKGKIDPKRIFELVIEDFSDDLEKVFNYFNDGKKWYKEKNWEDAIKNFEKALSIRDDGPSQVFLERCLAFKESPPENWDGVYEFRTK